MTLNSVEWKTEILFDNNGMLNRHNIGNFIDNIFDNIHNDQIEIHPNDTKLCWIKEKNIKVLSCDENGQITWKLVEAVTRHPPINEDGSNTLLKIITKSGREVIATKAKSFLKRVDNKIIPVRGDELNIGDFVPVSNILPINTELLEWDISNYISKNKYIFMSEVKKAINIYNEYKSNNNRHWFKKNNGILFTVPYNRSDSFIDAYIGIGKNKGSGRRDNIIKSQENCVYPKNIIYQPADIPEKIPLNKLTGFFFGAYLSEGSCTEYHVLISNNDDKFNKKIDEFCNTFNLNYHIDEKITEKGRSKTIRIHSKVLTELLIKSFNNGALNKRIPAELLSGSDEFCKGIIDGYMSGDGCVDKKLNALSATSISLGLIEDVQQLLTRYNIQGTIISCHSALEYSLKKGMNAHLAYKLQLNAANTYKFKNIFDLTLDFKQDRLCKRESACNIAYIDIIPNVITKQFGDISISRFNLTKYIDKCTNPEDIKILENILEENIIYDEIIDIIEVKSEYPYVYDLTVQDTRNFNIYNGLCIRDTFHLSGVSSASKAVRGVPRIKELLSVTKNIKSPALTIYIKDEFNQDKKKCKEILNTVETTYFKDIVTSTKIYYDVNDFNTTIDDDKLFIDSYKEFLKEDKLQENNASPWLLRMEFNKEKMIENDITMIDLYHVIHDYYDNNVSTLFSDDNAHKLVFRIKIIEGNIPQEEKDIITELKALEKNIMETIIIKGIKKINKVSMSKKEYNKYNTETMTFDKAYEWILESSGSNLMEIFAHKMVNASKTITNNITEIYEILGIEAARQAIYNEIWDVIKDADLYVNYRHLSLLVDIMTNKGYLLSIDRHGINRVDIGPLAKSSFEETTDMLIKAGIFSEVDKINGVSANIMLGQISPCGTGDTQILIDEAKLSMVYRELDKIEEVEEGDEEICSNLHFSEFELPDIDNSIIKNNIVLKIV